mmetsp:Transcript_4822/g.11873  ORF Transcript_4822/g.11873 Transcript_4822/m.11873 type:complete len:180 (-) Transcript_4822:63-602(-)
MAGEEILVRLTTGAGRTRFSVPSSATLQELKQKIEAQTHVPWTSQQLSFEGNRSVGSAHSTKITELGISSGTMLFLANSKNAEIKSTVTNSANLLAKAPVAAVDGTGAAAGAAGGASSSSSGQTLKNGKTVVGPPPAGLAAAGGNDTAGGSSSSSSKKPAESSGILVNGKPMAAPWWLV